MRFEPKTEAECKRTFAPGVYQAHVMIAENKQSQKGNDMIAIVLRVYGESGQSILVRDWLLNTDNMAWKLRHFAHSCGLVGQYESGVLEAIDCAGCDCEVKLTVVDDVKYGPQNRVSDYVAAKEDSAKTEAKAKKPRAVPATDNPDDDVPF